MSDYFDRLDAQLAELTRRGAHREPSTWERGRLMRRRVTLAMTLTLVLAAALVIEFPAAASGRPDLPTAVAVALHRPAGL